MPRPADPAVREKLLAMAAEVLATDGPKALTTRRLATEAGTSTMAVYTYFGSMDELRRELRRDGFAYVCTAIDAVPRTDDAVADLATVVDAYVALGADNPAWYRALFIDLPPEHDDHLGVGVHQRLVALLDRCVDTGRFSRPEPAGGHLWAAEVWLAAHGVVHLTQSRLLPAEALNHLQGDMLFRLCVGFGDRPELARASIDSSLTPPA